LYYRASQPTPKPQETDKPSSTQVQTKRTTTASAEGNFERKTGREGVNRGAKRNKNKPSVTKTKKKREQGESSST